MYKYVLNSVVKIALIFAQYFEYYNIILRGAISLWIHCINIYNHANLATFGIFWGCCIHPLSPIISQIWRAIVHLWSRITCQISSGLVYCITLEGQKLHILQHSQLQHFVVVPCRGGETELNMGTWLKAFLYPMISKPFPYSNDFMAKWHSQTLLFKSVTDKKQTRIPKQLPPVAA